MSQPSRKLLHSCSPIESKVLIARLPRSFARKGIREWGRAPGPERQALRVCSRTAFHCYPPVPFACDMLSLTVDTQAAVTRSPDQKRRADALARHAEGGGSA